MRAKRYGLASLMLLVAILLVACGGQGSSTAQPSSTWRRMAADVLSTMDPSLNTDTIGGQTLVDTMEGLYRYKGQRLANGLATSVDVNAAGTTYTFHLRKSTWSDGTAVTASDFVFGWKRTVDPATKSEYAYLFSGIQNADEIMAGQAPASSLGVSAPNATTLTVTLAHAIPYFQKMLVNPAFFPQSEAAVKRYGKTYGTKATAILTNGPYTLKKWTGTENTWTEVRNPKFWDAKNVHLQTITTQVVKDSSTALNLYNTSKLDDVSLTGQQAASAKTNKDFHAQKQSSVFYLELNQKKVAAFANVKLRQAISMAIDRQSFITKVLGDSSLPATALTSSGLATAPGNGNDFVQAASAGVTQYTAFDLARAKTLWAAGLKELGQTSVTVELLSDDTSAAKATAEYLQSALQELPGMTVTIASVPFKTRLARSQARDFELVMGGWGADFPDPITFLDLYVTGQSYNNGQWSNAQYDAAIAASKTTDATDPAKRWADLVAAQKILTEQMGLVPLYQRVQAHLTNPKLKGLQYSPTGTYNYIGATVTD
ncbi:peptide ABC transporter substrate-binding protein [Lacticaseibacillus daqingensis]|uniref:peptide ABC transporter substrate-binding protein n=1 Tax=Lacticaseibacillus daqingensis TaxID=2486014 RepID=UPI000F7A3DFF|nr:peptide ABC transporter substrate-binding protein [Lacticaseibacillus daqingensis]